MTHFHFGNDVADICGAEKMNPSVLSYLSFTETIGKFVTLRETFQQLLEVLPWNMLKH